MEPHAPPAPVLPPARAPLPWALLTTYGLFHLGAVAGLALLPFEGTAALLLLTSYSVRMAAVTAGFHRYFSHRAYVMGRWAQLAVAVVGTMAWQRGPLWWASHHRVHHRTADTPADPHRPRDGWLHASFLWVFRQRGLHRRAIPDLLQFPELVALDRFYALPPVLLAVAMTAGFGWSGLVHGFLVPTLLCWHAVGAVNTVGHSFGAREFRSGDESTNHPLLALVTFGDGWHNGHHAFPRSARHGLGRGQLDLNYLLLRCCAALGLISGLRLPSQAQLDARRLAPVRAAADGE